MIIRTLKKKAVALAGIPAVIMVGLPLIVAAALNTDMVRHWLEDRINSRLTGHLAIAEHHLSFMGRYAEISGVALTTEGSAILRLDRLRLTLAPLALFTGTLKINSVQMENIKTRLLVEADGNLNLLNALRLDNPPGEPTGRSGDLAAWLIPRTVKVESLRIRKVHIIHEKDDGAIEIDFPELTMSGKADLEKQSGQVKAGARTIRFQTPASALHLETLDVNATLDHGNINPLSIKALTATGDINISGQINRVFNEPAVDLNLKSDVDLAGVKSLLELDHGLSGRMALNMTISGKADSPGINVGLTSRETVIGPVSIKRLTCALNGSDQAVDWEARADVPGPGMITAKGNIDLAGVFPAGLFGGEYCFDRLGFQAIADGSDLDLKRMMNTSRPLAGAAEAHIRVAGRGTAQERLTADFSCRLGINDFKPSGLAVAVPVLMQAEGSCREGMVGLDRLCLETAGITMAGQGRYEPATEGIEARLNICAAEISTMAGIAGYDNVSGRLDAEANVSGTFTSPVVETVIKGDNLVIAPVTIDDIEARAKLDGGNLVIERLDVRRRDSFCRVNGSIRLTDEQAATVAADPAMNLTIDSGHILLEDLMADHIRGEVKFSGRVAGSLLNPTGELSVQASRLKALDVPMNAFTADIRLQDRVLDINVEGDPVLTGRLNLADLSFSAHCRAKQADLAPWLAMAGRPDMGGKLTGSMAAAGSLTDLATTKASADIDRTVLFSRGRDWISAGPFHLNYQDGALDIPDVQLVLAEEGLINISGRLGIDGTVALDIDGNAPVALAETFAPDVQGLAGRMVFDANLTEKVGNPSITGVIELADAGMSLPETPHQLRDLNGKIRFQKNEILLEDIEGFLGHGRFRISGTTTLDTYQPVSINVRLSAQSLPVVIPDVMELKLDADLLFAKTGEKEKIQGEVLLLDGVYYRDLRVAGYTDVIRSSFQNKRALPPAVESRFPAVFKELSLDLALKHRLPLKVDNNVALLEIQPDVTIKGNLSQPVLLGQARVDAGEVLFRRRTFLIEKGVVSFTNPYQTEPHIDITAATTVDKWRINLRALGTTDELYVDLTSDPYEEQGDILSLLLFGRLSRDLNADGGSSQPPAQMLASFLATAMADDIKNATGLDIVEISPSESAGEGQAGLGRITLGARVSERLNLKYAIESNQDGIVQESASEYRLMENTAVSAFQNSSGVFGGRLVYRLEFR